MANNRIYLRCKQCGDVLFLGKTFSSEYYYPDHLKGQLENSLNSFFEEHAYCDKDLINNNYEPKLNEDIDRYSFDNQYDICYEIYNEEKI